LKLDTLNFWRPYTTTHVAHGLGPPLKLTNQEQEDEKSSKNLMPSEYDISRLRNRFDDLNGEKIVSRAANRPSKFERNPTVNESVIDVLL
jgi:hypothetical protein